MYKLTILIIICIAGFYRSIILEKQGSARKHLLISWIVQTIVLGYGLKIHELLETETLGYKILLQTGFLGGFGNALRIEMPLLFVILFLIFGYSWTNISCFSIKNNRWFYILLLFSFISLLNPLNSFKLATFVPLFFIVQFLLLLKLIEVNFTKEEIVQGIFDGLAILSLLQFFLSVCYPILGIEFFATVFRGENALLWSGRRGYLSAVGTFEHPGPLALFCVISAIFFLSCYFYNYKSRKSFLLVMVNIFVVVLSFSRTTYITSVTVIVFLFVIHKGAKKVWSFRNFLLFLSLSSVVLSILYLTPLRNSFVESDLSLQIGNRLSHYILGYNIWENSKFIGTGINSHLYFAKSFIGVDSDASYLFRNPIHNIHIIVLAETGGIGLMLWLYFFISRIYHYSKNCRTTIGEDNILNLMFAGVLAAFFLYGFFGWAPFNMQIYGLTIFLGYIASIKSSSPTSKNI
jgi:O-antigen ligase